MRERERGRGEEKDTEHAMLSQCILTVRVSSESGWSGTSTMMPAISEIVSEIVAFYRWIASESCLVRVHMFSHLN